MARNSLYLGSIENERMAEELTMIDGETHSYYSYTEAGN